ncbi:TcaA second domain-containing protein [Staphylococcus simiae]|uniref:Uncharacterized protein n=1 Tax=Staphylococcus simiae CCM 7213 = CCUG 51256 TaxID=911238 RepID=G5JJQ8_9STAP|nr:zinc-ribbon domain-containing protein [Staphylococcus simiae]EHJ07565.1 hypothetical protein SS7213T_08587 [Staphylococcus simiae CCM 7213 = CCUG 51256]PNZ14689.1 zinc ribbon domain-containing protein [Staphylococcus simiae]SNV55248.1 TcaA protein [Staphylococcus simiae]
MKFCKNCGQPLKEGVKVCTHCGTPVQSVKPQQADHNDTAKQTSQPTSSQPTHNDQVVNNSNHSESSQRHVSQQTTTGDSSQPIHGSASSQTTNHATNQTTQQASQHTNRSTAAQQPRQPHSQQPKRAYGPPPQHKKKSKKPLIFIIIIVVLVILLVAAFLILNKQLSPKNDAANIAHAIDKNDAKGLANQVTSDGKKLNEDEAKAFLAYVKTKGNLTKVANSIQSKTSDIKDGKAKQATIYANDSTVMSITKDGKKFFLFDKYRFDIPSYKVSLSPDNDGKLTYTFNGQKHDVNVKKDDTTTLGTFPTGDYRLKATKKINNKDFDGAVLINMSNDTTMATESFKQKKFNVTTENDSELNDVTIYVNGKNEGTDTSKTFGPYSPDEEVTVHAEGKIDNQIFKSDSVDVDTTNKEDGEVSDVTLKFDSDAIDKYVDAKDSKKSKSSSDSDSDKDSDSDSSSSSDEVTRSNVIDKVESYEGHKLDTDKYTFKEPEKHNGRWGFSFLDKDGDLAGSYFVDADDGYVTKFDEHGDEIGSGY